MSSRSAFCVAVTATIWIHALWTPCDAATCNEVRTAYHDTSCCAAANDDKTVHLDAGNEASCDELARDIFESETFGFSFAKANLNATADELRTLSTLNAKSETWETLCYRLRSVTYWGESYYAKRNYGVNVLNDVTKPASSLERSTNRIVAFERFCCPARLEDIRTPTTMTSVEMDPKCAKRYFNIPDRLRSVLLGNGDVLQSECIRFGRVPSAYSSLPAADAALAKPMIDACCHMNHVAAVPRLLNTRSIATSDADREDTSPWMVYANGACARLRTGVILPAYDSQAQNPLMRSGGVYSPPRVDGSADLTAIGGRMDIYCYGTLLGSSTTVTPDFLADLHKRCETSDSLLMLLHKPSSGAVNGDLSICVQNVLPVVQDCVSAIQPLHSFGLYHDQICRMTESTMATLVASFPQSLYAKLNATREEIEKEMPKIMQYKASGCCAHFTYDTPALTMDAYVATRSTQLRSVLAKAAEPLSTFCTSAFAIIDSEFRHQNIPTRYACSMPPERAMSWKTLYTATEEIPGFNISMATMGLMFGATGNTFSDLVLSPAQLHCCPIQPPSYANVSDVTQSIPFLCTTKPTDRIWSEHSEITKNEFAVVFKQSPNCQCKAVAEKHMNATIPLYSAYLNHHCRKHVGWHQTDESEMRHDWREMCSRITDSIVHTTHDTKKMMCHDTITSDEKKRAYSCSAPFADYSNEEIRQAQKECCMGIPHQPPTADNPPFDGLLHTGINLEALLANVCENEIRFYPHDEGFSVDEFKQLAITTNACCQIPHENKDKRVAYNYVPTCLENIERVWVERLDVWAQSVCFNAATSWGDMCPCYRFVDLTQLETHKLNCYPKDKNNVLLTTIEWCQADPQHSTVAMGAATVQVPDCTETVMKPIFDTLPPSNVSYCLSALDLYADNEQTPLCTCLDAMRSKMIAGTEDYYNCDMRTFGFTGQNLRQKMYDCAPTPVPTSAPTPIATEPCTENFIYGLIHGQPHEMDCVNYIHYGDAAHECNCFTAIKDNVVPGMEAEYRCNLEHFGDSSSILSELMERCSPSVTPGL